MDTLNASLGFLVLFTFSLFHQSQLQSEPTSLWIQVKQNTFVWPSIYNGMHNTLTLTPSLFLSNTHTQTNMNNCKNSVFLVNIFILETIPFSKMKFDFRRTA